MENKEEIQNKVIHLQEIKSVTLPSGAVKLNVTDAEGSKYFLWVKKSTGEDTMAYSYLKTIANDYIGRQIRIGFVTEVNGEYTNYKIISTQPWAGGYIVKPDKTPDQTNERLAKLEAKVAWLEGLLSQTSPQAAKTATERAELSRADESIIIQSPNAGMGNFGPPAGTEVRVEDIPF